MKKKIDIIPLGQLKDNLLIIKVGNKDKPATKEDIDNVLDTLKQCLADLDLKDTHILVTHHAVDFEMIGIKGLKNIKKEERALKKKAGKNIKFKNAIMSLDLKD